MQPEFEYLDKFGLVWSYHVKQFEKSMMKSQNTCEIPEDEEEEECGIVFLTAEKKILLLFIVFLNPVIKALLKTTLCNV